MTREEQFAFCEKCQHRKMDMKQGLVCGLTLQKPTFELECADFVLDSSARAISEDIDESPLIALDLASLQPSVLERLKAEQSLVLGGFAGLVAGLLCAVAWAVVSLLINYQIGYMAIGVGICVGFSVRKLGKGIEPVFGIWGAAIALFSCLLGNFFIVVGVVAKSEGLGYLEGLLLFNYAYLPSVMAETFSSIDLLFYALAAWTGYKFSFRQMTEKTLAQLRSE